MKLKLELLYKTIKASRRKRLLCRRPDIRRRTSLHNKPLRRQEKARKTHRVCAVKAVRSLPLQPPSPKPAAKTRSRSAKAEPEQFELQVARQKLTSVVTSAANSLSGKYLVKISVIEDFRRLIEDIRKLRFDG